MHRPGIARVYGDVFSLDGTTVEEVRDTHARTLGLIVAKVNEDVPVFLSRAQAAEDRAASESQAHRRNVEDVAGPIDFG
jgi:hypothetical protein